MRAFGPGPHVLDGGLATELERRGHDLDHPLWSARCLAASPDAIGTVHRAYLAAGADVITTATYQATVEGFVQEGATTREAVAYLRRGAELAQEAASACDRRVWVAASVGSYGAALADGSEYRGDYGVSEDTLVDFHRRRIAHLTVGVDVLACETIPCLAEAKALARCLREVEVPSWVAFSCRDDRHVAHGEPIENCVAALKGVASVQAIGVNCTAPRHVEALVRRIRQATDRAVVVYPNSGERWGDGWEGEGTAPEVFADLATRWVAAGATLVGGCCRTGPEHVAALADRLRG